MVEPQIRSEHGLKQTLGVQTTLLLDNVCQQKLQWFGQVKRMPADGIPHYALHSDSNEKK